MGVKIILEGKNMIELSFEDISYKLESDENFIAFLKRISKKPANNIVAIRYNGSLVDLTCTPTENGKIELISTDTVEGLEILRHSASHLMAHAVKRLFPNAKPTIGPAIKDGFYYDFDCETPFTEEDLPNIEAEMKKIVKQNISVKRKTMTKKEAIDYFNSLGETYKVEIISAIEDETVSFYEQEDFIDLCRGPHVPSTSYLKCYKLMSVAGSYWRGDSNNKMLSRIYGTAFASKEDLDNYLERMKEAKERDHRKLGKELDLYSFHEEGPGFPFWHPNGMALYKALEVYIREQNDNYGYDEVKTPIILNESLWHKSGHWTNFKENMYFTNIDDNDYAVKPMNCPGGLLIFNSKIRSYRDLPLRNAELGLVHRHELSGVLHGLFRVRSFTQDDAHIFCTPEQMKSEIETTIEYTLNVYKAFGFKTFDIFVATRPEKSIGTDEEWSMATDALCDTLKGLDIDFKIKEGEGAFYGPKIEFNIKDVLERNWQCGTIQVDLSMPQRFEIGYEGSDGKKHTPIMIHRAIFGSLERFIGILVEHYNGKFPLWLSPVQIGFVNVLKDEEQLNRVHEVAKKFKNMGFRVDINDSDDNLGSKIRKFRLQRMPYTVIIGETECKSGKVSLRSRSGEEYKDLDLDELLEKLLSESKRRMNDSIFST